MSAHGLAQRLREETAPLHRAAERSRFMAALLAGDCDVPGYLNLLRHLMPIYAALEHALAALADHPWLQAVWSPALSRLPALRADIDHLQSLSAVPQVAALSAVASQYAARITALYESARDPCHGAANTAAARLLAHAYVRYLGDLSGGQMLRRIVRNSMGLAGDAGTQFYDFGSPMQAGELARQMRRALEALPDTGEAADAAVHEALWCFEQHLRLFEALDPVSRPG